MSKIHGKLRGVRQLQDRLDCNLRHGGVDVVVSVHKRIHQGTIVISRVVQREIRHVVKALIETKNIK